MSLSGHGLTHLIKHGTFGLIIVSRPDVTKQIQNFLAIGILLMPELIARERQNSLNEKRNEKNVFFQNEKTTQKVPCLIVSTYLVLQLQKSINRPTCYTYIELVA